MSHTSPAPPSPAPPSGADPHDAPAPPFGAEHSLHVEVELCGAERPSSSLRGGADKYIAAFKQLRASLALAL